MHRIKINLAKSAGFCFGVKRALGIALKTAARDSRAYMLGDIVHNETVVKEIEKSGIRKIKKLSLGKGKTLLIRAHGASAETINKALSLGYRIIDATCPMVKQIHKIVRKMEKRGYKIIVIGDRKHDEVRGITGQLAAKAIVVDNLKNLPLKTLKKIKKACLVAQSTQNFTQVLKIAATIKNYIPKLEFFNTICMPTRIKQAEIKKMPKENDLMIIIGSKTSANTKRLYEISKRNNSRTYWVSSKEEIRQDWLKGAKSVGITAGASTPDSTTRGVIKYIKQIR